MTDFTPTPDRAREVYALYAEDNGTYRQDAEAFDRMLDAVKAEAYQRGQSSPTLRAAIDTLTEAVATGVIDSIEIVPAREADA